MLFYCAAAFTFIAGILHLTLVPNAIDRNVNNDGHSISVSKSLLSDSS